MIKRKFFSLDHGSDGDDDDGSASSSSSSSEAAPVASVASDSDAGEERDDASSPSSENEDHEEDGRGHGNSDDNGTETGETRNLNETSECSDEEDSKNDKKKSRLRKTEDDKETRKEKSAHNSKGLEEGWMAKEEHVVRLKGVLKCKICPKIVCLNQETMLAHLSSKRHARSLKQFKEGRLKLMMTSDGELEEEGETHAERYARTIAVTQKSNVKRKNTGRQRQHKRAKQKFLKGEKAT